MRTNHLSKKTRRRGSRYFDYSGSSILRVPLVKFEIYSTFILIHYTKARVAKERLVQLVDQPALTFRTLTRWMTIMYDWRVDPSVRVPKNWFDRLIDWLIDRSFISVRNFSRKQTFFHRNWKFLGKYFMPERCSASSAVINFTRRIILKNEKSYHESLQLSVRLSIPNVLCMITHYC
jgi:hypothetical protein